MLRVSLIGNLGAEPEQRFAQEGASVVTFRVAVNSRRKGADGEYTERTDWFRVRSMGQRAEYAARLQKGTRVYVAGRLELGEWQTREGETRTSLDVWADELVNVSGRAEGQPSGNGGQAGAPTERGAATASGAASGQRTDRDDEEDLPF